MKGFRTYVVIGVVAVAGLAPSAFAQASASTNGTATANVIAAITITSQAFLRFGDVVTGVGGTATINTTDARTGTAGLLAGGTIGSAQFGITGEPNRNFGVTLPADGTITVSNGAATMAVNGFQGTCGVCALSAGGAFTLKVGGTLTVGAAQATGSYTGVFPVSVAYQ